MKNVIRFVGLFVGCAAMAQSSANFQLEQPTLNQGGHPLDGSVMSSTNHRISLDSLGEGVTAVSMVSASFRMDAGLVTAYGPPGEVAAACGAGFPCLTLERGAPAGTAQLNWPGEPNVGTYDLYRDVIGNLPRLGFGTCDQLGLTSETATDTTVPGSDGFFYLVTAVNRLGEQGTKGVQSNGAERLGNTCP
jgi:hypothetical protein